MKKIFCNKCGHELSEADCYSGFSINSVFGYGSKHDGCTISIDLCSACMEEIAASCVINPIDDDSEWW